MEFFKVLINFYNVQCFYGFQSITANVLAIGTVACVAPAAGNCAYRLLSEVTDFLVM